MYCDKCGMKAAHGAHFCSSCGAPLPGEPSLKSSRKDLSVPLFIERPFFIPWVTLCSIIPLQIFFTVWGGMFFGGFGLFTARALGLSLPPWFMFVFFGCLFFIAIPFITYYTARHTYKKTEFRFYETKLDYYEGFFTVEEKTIDYRSIMEVNLRKNIFQRKYNLGTIILSTPATGYSRGTAASGIRVYDIKDPDPAYRRIKELIARSR